MSTNLKALFGGIAVTAILLLGFAAKATGPGPFNAITVADSAAMTSGATLSMHSGSAISYRDFWTEYQWMVNLTGESIAKGQYVCYDRTGDTAVAVHHMSSAETAAIADSINTQAGGPSFYVMRRRVSQAAGCSSIVRGITAAGATKADTLVGGIISSPGEWDICTHPFRKILSVRTLNVTNHDTTVFIFSRYPAVRQGTATGDTAWAGVSLDSSVTRGYFRVATAGYVPAYVKTVYATVIVPGTPLITYGATIRGALAISSWTPGTFGKVIAEAAQPTRDTSLVWVKLLQR